MSTIVKAVLSAEQFGLAETLDRLPNTEFRMVRLVAHGADSVMPFLWAACDDPDELRAVVRDDPSVDDVETVVAFDSECLLKIDWRSHVRVLLSLVGEQDATVLDAAGRDGHWRLQIFFPEHERASTALEQCEEYGIDVEFERIDRLSETCEYGHLGLTECQYQTLVGAYGAGYYDVPRKVTQEELAQCFGVSHQALSERLRRAHQTVLTNALHHEIHRRDHEVSPRMRPRVDT